MEAVLSSALVAIAGMGVLMMFATAHTFVQSSGTDRIAAQLAQQRIEQVRATGYGDRFFTPDPRVEPVWTPVPNNPGYERTTIMRAACSTDFAIAWNAGGCNPPTTQEQTRVVVVTVRALNGTRPETDPQTTPVVMQTVLVRR